MNKLLVSQLKEATYGRTVWQATPPKGTTLEEVQHPVYWAHNAKRIQAGDRLEVIPEGREWFAELIVLSKTDISVGVKLLRHYPLVGETAVPESKTAGEPYYIKFRGPKNNWCVMRASDHAVVKEGMTKDEAAAEAETMKLAA